MKIRAVKNLCVSVCMYNIFIHSLCTIFRRKKLFISDISWGKSDSLLRYFIGLALKQSKKISCWLDTNTTSIGHQPRGNLCLIDVQS